MHMYKQNILFSMLAMSFFSDEPKSVYRMPVCMHEVYKHGAHTLLEDQMYQM